MPEKYKETNKVGETMKIEGTIVGKMMPLGLANVGIFTLTNRGQTIFIIDPASGNQLKKPDLAIALQAILDDLDAP